MGKGKNKPNGYTEFVFELKKKERNAGRFHNNEEMFALAKPFWERLSQEEKDVYRKRAVGKPGSKTSPPKFTSHGILISEMDRQREEMAMREQNAKRRINDIVVSNYLDGTLAKTPFHFIMANYFVKTTYGVYYPAELALIKFNFEDGVIQKYHQYMNPETLPVGYAFEALEQAKVHRLKVPPNAMGVTRFDEVYDELLKFLKDSNTPAADGHQSVPVFVSENNIEMIKSILSQLPEQPDAVQRDIDVLSLNTLFNELQNVDALEPKARLSIHVSNMLLEADRYDSTLNIACSYHEEQDAALKCALSICRRWFYTFCDHICTEKLNVPLVAGVHLPDNADVDGKHLACGEDAKPSSSKAAGHRKKIKCERDLPKKSG